jgi:hypothetical protein
VDAVFARRIQAAQTLEELFAVAEAAVELEPDDGYDLLQALDENRRRAGDARPSLVSVVKKVGRGWHVTACHS